MAIVQDPLWPEFEPLWEKMRMAGNSLLVAGGYGLFLKQNWLLSNPQTPTVVALGQWIDATPRVTKDLDIVVGLDLIADESTQSQIWNALETCGYDVTEDNARWQFEKSIAGGLILVELHAPLPSAEDTGLEVRRERIKRKPSLGEKGIHGRTNPEAVGSHLQPFQFEIRGQGIAVPNPVTWSIMKLTAVRDRWKRSEDPSRSEQQRSFSYEHAIKHAQDVCRVAAMATRDESDRIVEVIKEVQSTPAFAEAVDIYEEFFQNDEGWGSRNVANKWRPEDHKAIRQTLAEWFR